MFKRYATAILILVPAMIVSVQLGFEAEAARSPYVSKFNIYNGSICADATLRRLGYAYDTALEFSIFNLSVSYETDNPADNAPNAGGVAHVGEAVTVFQEVTPEDVTRNGTAELTGLCIDTDSPAFIALIEEAVLPNSQWTLIGWDLLAFNARFVITEFGDPRHVVEASCVPGFGADWTCTVYYDSQAR
jgi:hypothetical protein